MKPSTEDRPLLADVRRELGALGAELREMAAARWELARLELESDFRSARRLAVALFVAAVMALVALPLAAAALAEAMEQWTGVSSGRWLLAFAGVLLVLSGLGSYLAWRRFCRKFIGLRETIEELREDMVWLKEK